MWGVGGGGEEGGLRKDIFQSRRFPLSTNLESSPSGEFSGQSWPQLKRFIHLVSCSVIETVSLGLYHLD